MAISQVILIASIMPFDLSIPSLRWSVLQRAVAATLIGAFVVFLCTVYEPASRQAAISGLQGADLFLTLTSVIGILRMLK